MIEEFYRATDNNGSCWDFSQEPKWRAGFWQSDNGEYTEYTGPNKPAPGKCEKRCSVPKVWGISDIATLEHLLIVKDREVNDLRTTLNGAMSRAADLESEVKNLKRHRDNQTKDIVDQSKRLAKAQDRVAELEKQSKVMPKPVEEVYLRIKNTCLSTSKLGQLATEIGEYYNPFRVERVGIYETKCGLKVYVYLKEGVDWHCHVEGYGHQIVTESGSCMDGKVQLVKRIGDL